MHPFALSNRPALRKILRQHSFLLSSEWFLPIVLSVQQKLAIVFKRYPASLLYFDNPISYYLRNSETIWHHHIFQHRNLPVLFPKQWNIYTTPPANSLEHEVHVSTSSLLVVSSTASYSSRQLVETYSGLLSTIRSAETS